MSIVSMSMSFGYESLCHRSMQTSSTPTCSPDESNEAKGLLWTNLDYYPLEPWLPAGYELHIFKIKFEIVRWKQ